MKAVYFFLICCLFPYFIEFFLLKMRKRKMTFLNLSFIILFSNVLSLVIFYWIFRIKEFNYSVIETVLYILLIFFSTLIVFGIFDNSFVKTVKKVNRFVERLSNRRWLFISFFTLLFFMLIVSPRIICEPWLMVEDGFVFLNQQFKYGLNAIFDPFGGYCILLSRLSAWSATHVGKITNSIIVTVMVLKWITILYEVFVINYLNDNCFKWFIKNRLVRLLVTVILMYTMGNFQFLFYNTTSVHWFCGMLCFVIGLNIVRGELPKGYIFPFLLIGILSSPSALPLGFSLVYYVFKKIKLKSFVIGTLKKIGFLNFIKLTLIALCLLLQIIAILSQHSDDSVSVRSTLFDSILHVLFLIGQAPFYILGVDFAMKFNNPYFSTIIGGIVLLVFFLLFVEKKELNIYIYSILTVFCLYFMTLFKNSNANYYLYLFSNKYWFYHAVPAVVINYICIYVIEYIFVLRKWKYGVIVYLFIFVCMCQHLYYYSYEYTKYLWDIEKKVDFNSKNYISVPIFPDDGRWYLNVPIK